MKIGPLKIWGIFFCVQNSPFSFGQAHIKKSQKNLFVSYGNRRQRNVDTQTNEHTQKHILLGVGVGVRVVGGGGGGNDNSYNAHTETRHYIYHLHNFPPTFGNHTTINIHTQVQQRTSSFPDTLKNRRFIWQFLSVSHIQNCFTSARYLKAKNLLPSYSVHTNRDKGCQMEIKYIQERLLRKIRPTPFIPIATKVLSDRNQVCTGTTVQNGET